MACEDCSNYQPMSAEDGYCERRGIIASWNDGCGLEYEDDFEENDDEYDYEYSKHSYDFSKEKWTTSTEFIENLNKHDYIIEWIKVDFSPEEESEEYNQYYLNVLNNDNEIVIESMFTFWNDYDGDKKYRLEIDGFNSGLYEKNYIILNATTLKEVIKECNEILKSLIIGLNSIKFNIK